MSLIGIEGFDAISNSADAQPFDTGNVSGVGTTLPRYTGGQHCTGSDINLGMRWSVANRATVVMGAAIMRDQQFNGFNIFRMYEAGTCQVTLTVDYDNRVIRVYRGDGGTLLGTSAVLTSELLANNWCYVEWKVVIHNTTGSIEVRLNGSSTPILNLTGVNTRQSANAWVDAVRFDTPSRMDDIYALDTVGAAPFNDFLGDCRVYTLVPTSDDAVQFTPLSGTNFSNVDDLGSTGIDEDSTYVESSTVGHVDSYGLADLPVGVTPLAIEHRFVARKTDAGVRQLRGRLNSGGTVANGTTRTLGTAYVHYRDIHQVDPTDSAAWTKAKVDALKTQIEVIA